MLTATRAPLRSARSERVNLGTMSGDWFMAVNLCSLFWHAATCVPGVRGVKGRVESEFESLPRLVAVADSGLLCFGVAGSGR